MLKIRKPLLDSYGNVDMLLKHYDYDIVISSRFDNSNLKAILEKYGTFTEHKNHHHDFSKSKKFVDRCYKLSYLSLEVWAESQWGDDFMYKWFVRDEGVEDKLIKEILAGKHQLYVVRVTITKFGVGLVSISSTDNNAFIKVTSQDSKENLVELINEMTEEAWDYARRVEPNVFSGVCYMGGRN